MQVVRNNKAFDKKHNFHMSHPSKVVTEKKTYRQRGLEQNVQEEQNLQRHTSHSAPHFQQRKSFPATSHFLQLHRSQVSSSMSWPNFMNMFPNIIFDYRKMYCVLKECNFLIAEQIDVYMSSVKNFGTYFGLGVMQRNQLPEIRTLKQSSALYCPTSRKEAGNIVFSVIERH